METLDGRVNFDDDDDDDEDGDLGLRRREDHKQQNQISSFLGATEHLYNWLCPLVGRLVGWLVGNAFVRRSTRRTILAYLALLKDCKFTFGFCGNLSRAW